MGSSRSGRSWPAACRAVGCLGGCGLEAASGVLPRDKTSLTFSGHEDPVQRTHGKGGGMLGDQ